jgi:hypothetical protein
MKTFRFDVAETIRSKPNFKGSKMDFTETNYTNDVLQLLIIDGHLDGPALGIAQLVIDRGEDCLSGKQHDVYNNYILPFFDQICKRCGCNIEPHDLYSTINERDQMCGVCRRASLKG